VDVPKISGCPVVGLHHGLTIGGDGCSVAQSNLDLTADKFCSNNEVGLGHWNHWIAIGGTGHRCRGGVSFGSSIAVDVEHLRSHKWSVVVFILVTFDVVEGRSNWVTLTSSFADCLIYILVIRGSVVGSYNFLLTEVIYIGNNTLIVTKTMDDSACILSGLVTGNIVAEE